jgi:hypothetical protein
MFGRQVAKDEMRTVLLEYAWDMSWCDPCAADPLSQEELRALGAFWLEGAGGVRPAKPSRRPSPGGGGAAEVFLTRLHVRYDAAHFPEDLAFQETGDRDNFQGRYVVRHAWKGGATCEQAASYRRELRGRWDREARTLAELTGWDVNDIRRRMNLQARATAPGAAGIAGEDPWWKRLWNQ